MRTSLSSRVSVRRLRRARRSILQWRSVLRRQCQPSLTVTSQRSSRRWYWLRWVPEQSRALHTLWWLVLCFPCLRHLLWRDGSCIPSMPSVSVTRSSMAVQKSAGRWTSLEREAYSLRFLWQWLQRDLSEWAFMRPREAERWTMAWILWEVLPPLQIMVRITRLKRLRIPSFLLLRMWSATRTSWRTKWKVRHRLRWKRVPWRWMREIRWSRHWWISLEQMSLPSHHRVSARLSAVRCVPMPLLPWSYLRSACWFISGSGSRISVSVQVRLLRCCTMCW